MPERGSESTLRTAAGAVLLIGCLAVIFPFLTDTLWAVVLCFSTWPIYARLVVLLRGRRTLAAVMMTAGILLVLVAPFAVIAMSLSDDIPHATDRVRVFLDAGLPQAPAWVAKIPLAGARLTKFWSELAGGSAERMAQLRRFVEPLKSWLLVIAAGLASGLFHMLISLLIALFFYRDGAAAAERVMGVTDRLGGEHGRALLDLAGRTVRAVVYGILGTALAQGLVAGIGFFIARVPSAALLALLTFFLSVIPVGPLLIWVPVMIYFFSQGSIGWGVFMLVWGVLISSVDNVVKPLIISRGGGGLSFIVILLGILGGATTFGFIGVFLGPTLLAVGVAMLRFWTLPRPAPASAPAVPASIQAAAADPIEDRLPSSPPPASLSAGPSPASFGLSEPGPAPPA